MQKHVNLVDLVKSFPTNIFLQNLASIQKRTSPVQFAHLAEKSRKGSISNVSTKAMTAAGREAALAFAQATSKRKAGLVVAMVDTFAIKMPEHPNSPELMSEHLRF